MYEDIERVLFREEDIRSALRRVAAAVTEAYEGQDLTVVSVLKGSCIFCADLIRQLPMPLELAFVAARSYGDGTVSGELELQLLPRPSEVAGRHLLLIDDILDTGRTLSVIRKQLYASGAAEVRTCVFLDKPARRVLPFQADFVCLEVEDVFAVGYGLDFAGRYRNLPYVGCLKASVIAGAGAGTDE